VKREKYSEEVVEYVTEFFLFFIKEVLGESSDSSIEQSKSDIDEED
jgi:hypothetical protein